MSKKKNSKKKGSSDEIVVSLDQIAVPGAIILAGVIIAVAVFLSNKNGDNSIDDSGDETVAGEETTTQTDSEFESAVTDIGNAPYIGDRDNAKVAVVEYNEYLCSYCLRHKDETLPLLVKEYVDPGEIIYVFREYPIYGEDAANAAKCVYHIGGIEKYEEFHKGAFNYESDDDLYALAKEVGVNEEEFDSCYSSKQYQEEVDADFQAAQDIGIQGTPGFVVGTFDSEGNVSGVLVPGAYPIETFEEIIEGYLSE
jgi:protein-disulfide isomerase